MRKDISIWQDALQWQKCDLAIIGAGIVGLSAAIYARILRPDWQVVVFEKALYPDGATVRNAGFACFGSPSEIIGDLKMMEEEAVISIIRKRYLGLQALFSLVPRQAMDFENTGSFDVFFREDRALFEQVQEQLAFLNQLVEAATGLQEVFTIADDKRPHFGFNNVDHLVQNRWEGTLHSGKMMAALLRKAYDLGVRVYWGYEMVEYKAQKTGKMVLQFSNNVPFHTKKLLIANNGFANQLFPELDVYPVRNQVMVTSPIQGLNWKGAFHKEAGYVYFRNVGNRVLIGGARHLDFEGSVTGEPGEIREITSYLNSLLSKHILPEASYAIEYSWNGFLGLGATKEPIVQLVEDQIGVAVRLGGMGVAIGTLVGKEAAEMLCK